MSYVANPQLPQIGYRISCMEQRLGLGYAEAEHDLSNVQVIEQRLFCVELALGIVPYRDTRYSISNLSRRVISCESALGMHYTGVFEQIPQGADTYPVQTPDGRSGTVVPTGINTYPVQTSSYPPSAYPYISPPPQKPKRDWSEFQIGKYLLGSIAALLVFAAAISLVVLLWDNFGDWLKFGLIMLVGVIFLGAGYFRLSKASDVISSVLLGIGSGLTLIAIMSGYIAFDLFSPITVLALTLAWVASMIASYRYTRLFFMSAIAYVGIFLSALFFQTNMVETAMDMTLAVVFILAASVALLVSVKFWADKTKQYIIGAFIYLLPLIPAFFFISTYTVESFGMAVSISSQAVIIAMIYGIYFFVSKTFDAGKGSPKLLAIEAMLAINALVVYAFTSMTQAYGMPFEPRMLIALGIMVLVFAFTYRRCLMSFVTLGFMLITLTGGSNYIGYAYGFGILALCIAFMRNARFNGRGWASFSLASLAFLIYLVNASYNYSFSIGGISPGYSGTIYRDVLYLIEGLAMSAAFIILAHRRHKSFGICAGNSPFKLMGMLAPALFLSSALSSIYPNDRFFVREIIASATQLSESAIGAPLPGVRPLIAMSILCLLCILYFFTGYFKHWKEGFWSGDKTAKLLDLDISGYVYIGLQTVLYLACFSFVSGYFLIWQEATLSVLTLGVLATQSYILIGRWRHRVFPMLCEGIKYFVFSWVVLGGIFEAPLSTIMASVVAMGVAFICICAGVYLKVKTLRFYGLTLTVAMALKILIIDMAQSPTITRIIACMVAGLVCLVLAFVYSKVEQRLKAGAQKLAETASGGVPEGTLGEVQMPVETLAAEMPGASVVASSVTVSEEAQTETTSEVTPYDALETVLPAAASEDAQAETTSEEVAAEISEEA